MKRIYLLMVLITIASVSRAWAGAQETMLKQYEAEARKGNAAFTSSPVRGKTFYYSENTRGDGKKVSCASCHSQDPKSTGMTRANKVIQPMAVVANPERFTDSSKIEKWFARNCNDVYERVCTPAEKADFIAFMLSVK